MRGRGATDALIESLPVFRFRRKVEDPENPNVNANSPIASIANQIDSPAPLDPTSQPKPKKVKGKRKFRLFKGIGSVGASNVTEPPFLEVEEEHDICAICIETYKEGESLRQLKCNHHFHVTV